MSSLREMVKGTYQPVIETNLSGKKGAKNLVFMSGKVFHDVQSALKESEKLSARLVRVEELYPFPQADVARILKETGAQKAFWVQEEPQNMGAWSYIAPLLREALGFDAVYVGRPAAAATATGSGKHHALEQKAILTTLAEALQR
jgi:2-oxoglutarate dehydrogenase E1 component